MTAPVVVSARLELWRPQADDRAGLLAMMQPEAMRAFLGGMQPDLGDVFARLLRNAGCWSLYGYGTFIVRERGGDGAIVGNCGVFRTWRGFGKGLDDVPEAGWIVARPAWGKGYAQEAMAAAIGWFDREHGAQRIACMIEDGHRASQRVAARLGFVAYDRHQPEGEARPLILYERRP